jgi:hypothetical protein
VVGRDRLFEPFGAALPLAKQAQGIAQIGLGFRPTKWNAFARSLLQHLAKGRDRLAYALPCQRFACVLADADA